MRTKPTQGELDVRTQFQRRAVAIVEQLRALKYQSRGLSTAELLLDDCETFLRDWLATVEEP